MLELPTVKNYFRHLDVLRIFMKSYMRVLAREAHEIFRAIVSFLFIDVVNNFLPCQISPKNFLNNKTMLVDAIIDCGGMPGAIDEDVPFTMGTNASKPMRGFLPSPRWKRFSTFHRASNRFPIIGFKGLFADAANFLCFWISRPMALLGAISSFSGIQLSQGYKKLFLTRSTLPVFAVWRRSEGCMPFFESSKFISHAVTLPYAEA